MSKANQALEALAIFRDLHKNIERRREEGFGWDYDGIDDWSTEAIFAKLRELGIDTDAERFHEQARTAGTFASLENDWHRQATDDDKRDIGLWVDFVMFAVPLLWERLASDVLCWELIERRLNNALQSSDDGKPLPEVDGMPATIATVIALLDYLDSLPEEKRPKEWDLINHVDINYAHWFIELLDEEAEDRPDFVKRLGDFLCHVTNDAYVDAHLAKYLVRSGRNDEALARIRKALDQEPGDFDVHDIAADIHHQLGDDAEAVRLWIEALPLAKDVSAHERVIEAIKPALDRLGGGAELDEIRRLHPAPIPKRPEPRIIGTPFEPPPRIEPPKPLRIEKKIGRNDPCPCGSGRKYKKCCME